MRRGDGGTATTRGVVKERERDALFWCSAAAALMNWNSLREGKLLL